MKKIAAPEQKLICGGHGITVVSSTSAKTVQCSYLAKNETHRAYHNHYIKTDSWGFWKTLDCASWF